MCVRVEPPPRADSSGGCSTIPLPDKPLQIIHTHTHRRTPIHQYINIYIYICVCVSSRCFGRFLFSFWLRLCNPRLSFARVVPLHGAPAAPAPAAALLLPALGRVEKFLAIELPQSPQSSRASTRFLPRCLLLAPYASAALHRILSAARGT